MSATPRRKRVRIRLGMGWRLLLISGMMYAVMLSVLEMVRAGGVEWRGGYLALGALLLPFETYVSQRMVKRRELRGGDLTRFRLAEAGMLVLALTLLRYLWQGLPALGGRAERLFDFEFFVGAFLILTFWSVASAMIRWFEELEFQESEAPPPVTSPEYDLWVSSRVRHVQHTASFQRILAVYLIGGVLVLILAGMSRVDPRAIIDFQRGTIRALIMHVLLYFILGLALVAEARLSLLYTRWQHEDVTVSPTVARRWPLFVGALLLLSVLVALLLPVDYSVGLIEALSQAVNVVISLMITLVYILLYLMSLLLYPFQWLMQAAGGEGAPPPPQFSPPEQAEPTGPAPPILDILKTLAFWLIAVGIVIYVLYNFAREHGAAIGRVPLLRPLLQLLLAVAGLWQMLRRGATRAGRGLASLSRRVWARPAAAAGRRRRVRLRDLTPRQLVQYYYLSTVQRAEGAGLRRRPNQTADEFSAHLAASLPEADEDVDELTDAFVEARYSRHPVEREDAGRLRPVWEHIRQVLRQRRRPASE